MNRTVIVAGIPGSGNATVCNHVEKLAKNAGVKANVANYGTVMMGLVEKHGKGMERNKMRKDNLGIQRGLQREVVDVIAEKMKQLNSLMIVDTHMSIKTSAAYLLGLPSANLSVLKPDLLVLVEAEARKISTRRMKDSTRKRGAALEETAREELLFSRFMAGASAVLAHAPAKIVIEAEGWHEEAAKETLEALEVA